MPCVSEPGRRCSAGSTRLARKHRGQRGFTLFEMVVAICSIVILYMMAVNRLDALPAAAERAAFQGTVAQMKTGVQLYMLSKLTSGGMDELLAMEGGNPMEFMLEHPRNYRGPVAEIAPGLRRGSWYYEVSSGELVYLVGTESIADVWVDYGVTMVMPGEIRFKVTNVVESGAWQALLLREVRPYEWRARFERMEDAPGVPPIDS